MLTYDANTTSEIEIGTVATHLCDAGFTLVGNMNRTCVDENQEDIVGVWSETAPSCDGKSLVILAIAHCMLKPFPITVFHFSYPVSLPKHSHWSDYI